MTNKRLTIGKLQLRATDGLILATLTFFTLLAIIFFTRIEGAERLLFVPDFLPLGFDQMKRILSAAARH